MQYAHSRLLCALSYHNSMTLFAIKKIDTHIVPISRIYQSESLLKKLVPVLSFFSEGAGKIFQFLKMPFM